MANKSAGPSATVVGYFQALLGAWLSWMSGAIGVVLSVVALVTEPSWLRIASAIGAVIAFFVAGYELWRSERIRVIDLEEELVPRLDLRFEPRDPWIRRVERSTIPLPDLGTNVEAPSIWYNVRVTSVHDGQTARGCRADLTKIEFYENGRFQDTDFAVSQLLGWAENNDRWGSIDIPFGTTQYVNVISIDSIWETIFIKWRPPGFEANRRIFERHGTYRLTLVVNCDVGSSATIRLLLVWDGKWDGLKMHEDTELSS